jgi:hypothetical protein
MSPLAIRYKLIVIKYARVTFVVGITYNISAGERAIIERHTHDTIMCIKYNNNNNNNRRRPSQQYLTFFPRLHLRRGEYP